MTLDHEKNKSAITNKAMRLYNDQKYDDEFMDELFQNPKFMSKVQERVGYMPPERMGYMPRERTDPYGYRDEPRGLRGERAPQRYGTIRELGPPVRRSDVRLPTLKVIDDEAPPQRTGGRKTTRMTGRDDDAISRISRSSRGRKKTMTKSMKV